MGTGAKQSNMFASRFLGEFPDPDHSVFRFTKDPERGRAFERLAVRGYAQRFFYASEFDSDHSKRELAVLQRITLSDGKVVFLCAGKDSPGTMMVSQYLADNWRTIFARYKDHKNGDFARLYVFSYDSPSTPELLASEP
jgi:hypothetical protein